MTGLIAVFDANGSKAPMAGLIARLPTHASQSEQWQDQFCAMARLHHGVIEIAPQPVFNDDQSLCLFLDGEIYTDSRAETELPAAKRLMRTHEYEASALATFNGSFAAIIYNRARHSIALVSDRLATRPLYYFRASRSLVVASHIAALTVDPRCPKQIDRDTVHQVLSYEQVIGHGTIYRGVHCLEPGAILNFDGETIDVKRYWAMRWRAPYSSKEQAGDALADQLRKAVNRRVNGKPRAGLLLSGGFDSRLILAAAEQPPLCITQATSRNREVEIAERAASLAGAEFHFIQVDPARRDELFDEAVRLSGGVQKPQGFHFLPMMERIREWCDVLLSGWAFNSIYRGMLLPARTIKIGRYAAKFPRLMDIRTTNLVPLIARTQLNMLKWATLAPVLNDKARREHYAVLEDAVRDGLRGFDESHRSSPYDAWEYLSLHAIARHSQYGNVLSVRTWMDDRIVALDFDLVDAALRLRPEWRFPPVAYQRALRQVLAPSLADLPHAGTGTRPSRARGGAVGLPTVTMKRMLKHSLRHIRIGSRSETAQSLGTQGSWPDFEAFLRHHPPVRDRLRRLPESEALSACDMFDPSGLRRAIDAHIEGKQNNMRLMFSLLMLESWIRQFGAE